MSSTTLTDAAALRPIASNERIQALDVVRGFALIGIFLMNIEWYSRPIADLGSGLPTDATGANYWAGWFVYTFVQGKFWTMFSLLFGMGFAVMLTRAERAGRDFLTPYIRRVAALAVFGAMHHIFLWAGDILFSYAVGATMLLFLLWGDWKALLGFFLLALVCAIVGKSAGIGWLGSMGAVAFGMGVVCLAASYLRWESRFLPILLGTVSVVAFAAALLAGRMPNFPVDARIPALIFAVVSGTLSYLALRFKQPREKRPVRLGPTLYLLPFTMMLSFGLLMIYGPAKPQPSEAQVAAAVAEIRAERAEVKAGKHAPASAAAKVADGKPVVAKADKPEPTDLEKAAQNKAQQRLAQEEQVADADKERKVATTGTYMDFVRMRAAEFGSHATGEFGFGVIIIGMFLLGYWFVRSGIMEHTGDHLPLFRKLALWGIPVGVGLGLLGQTLTTHANPGMDRDPFQAAVALLMIGNLPACLGYVSLIVLMLHSHSPFARIRVLAPLGRMALTNYLTHSLVCSLYFYGYAGGHWGMPRATQVGFVFLVIALQVVFCHWWLSKFRYGPMEWLWRAITYWTLPPMRREQALLANGAAA